MWKASLIPSPTLDPGNINLLSQAAIDFRLPMVAGHSLEEAVLLTLMSDLSQAGRRAARLARQVLQGIRPEDLPVETGESVAGHQYEYRRTHRPGDFR